MPVPSLPVSDVSPEARRKGVGHPDEIVPGQAAGLLFHVEDRGRRTHARRVAGVVLEALCAAVPRLPQVERRRDRVRHPAGVRPVRPAARPPDGHHRPRLVDLEDEGHGAGLVGGVLREPPDQGVLRPGERRHRPRPLRHQEPSGPPRRVAAAGRLERQDVPLELAVERLLDQEQDGVVAGADRGMVRPAARPAAGAASRASFTQ